MTDQNQLNRDDSDMYAEDDPLSELARIISGRPAERGGRGEREKFSDERRPADRQSATVASAGEDELDIEAMLARELGDSEPGSEARKPAHTAQAKSQTAAQDDDELSLEERLMAELTGDSDEAVRPSETAGQRARNVDDENFERVNSIVGRMRQEFASDEKDFAADQGVKAQADTEGDGDAFEEYFETGFAEALREDVSRESSQSNLKADTRNQDLDDIDFDFGDDFEAEMDQLGDEAARRKTASVAAREPERPTVRSDPEPEPEPEYEPEPQTEPEEFIAATVEDEVDTGALEDEFEELFAGELDMSDLEAEFAREEMHSTPPPRARNVQGEPAVARREAEGSRPDMAAQPFRGDAGLDDLFAGEDEPATESRDDEGFAMAGDRGSEVDEAPGGKGFKLAVMALGMALVLGVGIVAWGLWSGGSEQVADAEPGLIEADKDPVKIKPDDPGGKEIANQDNQVYDRVAGNAVDQTDQEELLSERQDPVPVEPKTDTRLSPQEDQPVAESSMGLAPKRVRTLTVKPDGTIVRTDAPAETASGGEPASMALTPPTSTSAPLSGLSGTNLTAREPQTVTDTAGAANDAAAGQPDGSLPVPTVNPLRNTASEATNSIPEGSSLAPAAVQTVTVDPVSVAPATAPAETVENPPAEQTEPAATASLDQTDSGNVPTVSSSEWKMQISSQRSREAAESSYNNLRQRFSSILGDRTASIQTADIEGRGRFYQVKVLAESRDDAIDLCERLKRAGGSCFVTR